MPDPTVPDCIDRASFLIRAAGTVHSEEERMRLLEGAEAWLQLAKQQLIVALAKVRADPPKR